jgi:DNA-binding SARP family transcriptional activator
VEFRILGALEVVVAGGEPVALGSAQQRAVLALLVVSAPEGVSRDRLVDELWGENPPASARHAVQVYVSGIRRVLRGAGGGVQVRSSSSGYVLEVDLESVDARRFERLLDEAQRALADDPEVARERFEEALSLWRGQPLAGFEDVESARREAGRLEELRVLATEGLVEARLECGEHAEVIGQITDVVGANPLRERPRRLLMLALYRSGRHADALAAYRDAIAALDEIGLQPGPELRQLEEHILRHDPSLGAPQRPADVGAEPASASSAPISDADGSAGAPVADVADSEARQEQHAPARRRKLVTALFCDVTGSTALGEELDPEALVEVMNTYFR